MTRDEWILKLMLRMRGLAVIGYATRHTPPSGLGMEYDALEREMKSIAAQAWADSQPVTLPKSEPATNGAPRPAESGQPVIRKAALP